MIASRLPLAALAALTSAALALPGCAADAPAPAAGGSPCIAEALAAQPTERVPLGATLTLPGLSSAAACSDQAWALLAAPAGNEAALVGGADGFARFTPHLAGTYRFELPDGARWTATVTAEAPPFHNLNYYPGRSLARVGDEVWVADVLTATVTRLEAATLAPRGRVAVGAWPVALALAPDRGEVLVAQRAADTLGFVDVGAGRLVDAVWVGDEPANVPISADGAEA